MTPPRLRPTRPALRNRGRSSLRTVSGVAATRVSPAIDSATTPITAAFTTSGMASARQAVPLHDVEDPRHAPPAGRSSRCSRQGSPAAQPPARRSTQRAPPAWLARTSRTDPASSPSATSWARTISASSSQTSATMPRRSASWASMNAPVAMHPRRRRETDQRREEIRAARDRDHAEIDVALGEPRRTGGHPHVAGEPEVEPTRRGGPVVRRDQRLGRGPEQPHRALHGGHPGGAEVVHQTRRDRPTL